MNPEAKSDPVVQHHLPEPTGVVPEGVDPKQVVGERTKMTRADWRRLERLPFRLTLEDNLPVILNRQGKKRLVCRSNDGIRHALMLISHGRFKLPDGFPLLEEEVGLLSQHERQGRLREHLYTGGPNAWLT